MADLVAEKSQARKVVRRLAREYPDADCALVFETPFQLLIATILSAQCTDKRVNIVARELFRQYPTVEDLAAISQKKLEKVVQSTGFFRNKAKNIRACSQQLLDRHQGEVPREMEQLVSLAGVGRKTANVVLGTAFGQAVGVVVDTHVGRISGRVGLTKSKDPVRIERDLMAVLPRKEWIVYAHRMIHHGRAICKSQRPLCDECSMQSICPRIGVRS
jgi:endonuclease-3